MIATARPRRQPQRIKCYNCGQPGHRRAECTQPRRLICFSCGKEGHIAAECRERSRSNPRAKSVNPEETCAFCGERGHGKYQCRKRRLAIQALDAVGFEEKEIKTCVKNYHSLPIQNTNLSARGLMEKEANDKEEEEEEVPWDDYSLDYEVAEWVFQALDFLPEVDMCATRHSTKARQYFNLREDIFRQDWTFTRRRKTYGNFPFERLGEVVNKGKKYKAKMLMVFPLWGTEDWCREILRYVKGPILMLAEKDGFKPISEHENEI